MWSHHLPLPSTNSLKRQTKPKFYLASPSETTCLLIPRISKVLLSRNYTRTTDLLRLGKPEADHSCSHVMTGYNVNLRHRSSNISLHGTQIIARSGQVTMYQHRVISRIFGLANKGRNSDFQNLSMQPRS